MAKTRTAPRAALVAAAGNGFRDTGSPLTTAELTHLLERKRRDLAGAEDGAYVVATVEAPTAPVERHLDTNLRQGGSPALNSSKVEAVTSPAALTAAGICAPYTVDYAVDAIGVVDRPLRDSLPQFIADRGGVQFRRDIDAFADAGPASASGLWSLSTDANPGSSTKPIWDVPCASVVQAEVAAVTLGCRFSNITARFDPEATEANTKVAAIAHARYAELNLLSSMFSQCTATFGESKRLGATRDLFVAIDKVIAYQRDSRRLGDSAVLRIALRSWVRDLMRADLTRALHTGNEDWLGISDQDIEQWFANRGVIPTWLLDSRPAQPAAGGIPATSDPYAVLTGTRTIPSFPSVIEACVYPEGAFVYLDGGTLDVGLIRDQSLVQTNRYIQFSETFEGVYRKGPEAIRLVAELEPMGGSAGTVDPTGFND